LDNAWWHALRGPLAHLAETTDAQPPRAARLEPAVGVFAAMPDEVDEASWADLAALVGPGGAAVLLRGEAPTATDGWVEVLRGDGAQLIGPDSDGDTLPAPADYEHVELGPEDASEMLELVRRTQPGPFERRTGELGHYVGYRYDGALVAMSGERLRVDGFTEISAVCTDADHRGRGLARRLVGEVAHGIRSTGSQPFLHVASDNTGALVLYESMGFKKRRPIEVAVLQAPDGG
jgi:ribosomal protein S18 acetylase RimI-like enzyme